MASWPGMDSAFYRDNSAHLAAKWGQNQGDGHHIRIPSDLLGYRREEGDDKVTGQVLK